MVVGGPLFYVLVFWGFFVLFFDLEVFGGFFWVCFGTVFATVQLLVCLCGGLWVLWGVWGGSFVVLGCFCRWVGYWFVLVWVCRSFVAGVARRPFQ